MMILKDIAESKIKFLKTVVVSIINLAIGITASIIGPTLLDLQIAINSTLQKTGFIVPVKAFGYLVGCLSGCFLPEKSDRQPYLICCSVMMSVVVALIPLNRTLITLIVNVFFLGLFVGFLDLGVNSFILQLWGKKCAPYIQFATFFYGIGGLSAPLLTEPFLLPIYFEKNGNDSVKHQYTPNDLKLNTPYDALAIFLILAIILFTLIYYFFDDKLDHEKYEETNNENDEMSSKLKTMVIIIHAVLLKLWLGSSATFGVYLTPFAVKSQMNLSKSTGAFMVSLFYGTMTVFKIPAAFLMRFISIRLFIIIELTFSLVSSLILLCFGQYFELALWIATTMMGLGNSSLYAPVIAYVQNYIHLKNYIISIGLVGICLGEFLFQFVVAKFIDQEPAIFIFVSVFCNAAACFVFVLLEFVCRLGRR
ncbi:Sodium-dependent glucose transporter 1-like protein [Dinothrombium tinctorium]|uniref:Sodium-dependent glucose transporter 1-like protein n=1 Tax=Dinothrombium tinctorium TaxID=1965070 RepID=A0A3S3Q0Q0_9ACAR|nr:Sodium-dependent glucose transporter 1-like protein [Dinothrombium tinctorium]RWS01254.1 Sodium-dependent glucose transporter 1-like protein [Dinothrombium tinctorium]RWS03213.1 Sodium-dependent glucose transporter 1-like protein [Dinothrombium tinctorium]